MWRALFVVAFFALTLLPGFQMLTGAVPDRPVNENRALAPGVTASTVLENIPSTADRWFSDHFGLRSLMIRLKTQIDYSVFATSDRVLVGKDGQLFYRSTVNAEVPGMQKFLAVNEGPALDGLAALNRALNDAGIRMAVIVPMMSDRFYPELLPRAALRRPQHQRIDDFVARLREIPNLTYIDSEKLVRKATETRRTFYKTDFHWLDSAAFDVSKALVDTMSADEGLPASPWVHPLELRDEPISGGIARFMPLFVPPAEVAKSVKPTWTEPAGFRWLPDPVFFQSATTAEPDPRLLPPTVFLGDSYLDYMESAGLDVEFVETHRVRWREDLTVSDVVAHLPADTKWLVVEFIEVSTKAVRSFADGPDIALSMTMLDRREPAQTGESP